MSDAVIDGVFHEYRVPSGTMPYGDPSAGVNPNTTPLQTGTVIGLIYAAGRIETVSVKKVLAPQLSGVGITM